MFVLLLSLTACDPAPPASTDPSSEDTVPADTTADTPGEVDDGPQHPNIVFLMGEARGWTSTSVLQDPAISTSKSGVFQTPNLDTLASQGITFSRFYAPSPRCTPSRAAWITGKSPARLHMTFVGEGANDGTVAGDVIPPDAVTTLPLSEVTVAALLHDAGYATAHFGKWHLGNHDPVQYGFDESDGPNTNKGPSGEEHPNPAQAFATAASGVDFMTRQVAANKPFFLQISHYGGTEAVDSLPETYASETARLPRERESEIAQAAVVRDMDTTIGTLLDAVRDLGVEQETWIFFTADHGRAGRDSNEPLYQGKGSVWEGGIRVPLIVRGPGAAVGTWSPVMATQVDLLPTIAALAHLPGPLPAELEGADIRALLRGETTPVVRPVEPFVVHFPHYDKDPLGPASAIILGDEKLIRFYEDGSLRLYDLAEDYEEQHDLAPTQPARAAELEQRMDAWLTDVGAQMPGHL